MEMNDDEAGRSFLATSMKELHALLERSAELPLAVITVEWGGRHAIGVRVLESFADQFGSQVLADFLRATADTIEQDVLRERCN